MALPPSGVYVPAVVFFHEDETLDLDTVREHLTRLARAGVDGLVVQGSNGEAAHLDRAERQQVVRTARAVLRDHGKPGAVLVAGCGAQSTRETVQLCAEAREAGADYGLVLPPSYWVAAMTRDALFRFFDDVAAASPMPLLLYNFPGVTAGIDMDSELVTALAAANANIVGVKLTCGDMGKLQRVAHGGRPLAAFGGKADFFLHALVGGAHGVIAATANLAPRAHVRLLRLWRAGRLAEAQDLQTRLSRADGALAPLGVAGLKAALCRYWGYGAGRSRRPLRPVPERCLAEAGRDAALQDLVDAEAAVEAAE